MNEANSKEVFARSETPEKVHIMVFCGPTRGTQVAGSNSAAFALTIWRKTS